MLDNAPTEVDKPIRLLIAVDNSPDSSAAVNAVCSRHGSEVGLLTVVDQARTSCFAKQLHFGGVFRLPLFAGVRHA